MRRHWNELFRHDEWNIGVVEAPISAFLDPGFVPIVRWLPVESGTYVADPFGSRRAEGLEIVCEEWSAATGRGRLIRVDGTGRRQALEGFPAGLHHSYPYLIGEFCVPESWQTGSVRLYRRDALGRWAQEATLLPGVAGVDATLFQHEGRWWMAAANQWDEPERALYLWHASALTGPWQPHRANPVKRDHSSARSGGTPFVHAGALYRPAQDCSRTYGGALVINRVDTLTPEAFREHTVVRLEPRPEWRWNRGWHTLSAVDENCTLIDAKRVTFMPRECGRVLRRKLARQ